MRNIRNYPLVIKDFKYQDFYRQALELAVEYCPDWENAGKPEDSQDFNPEDPGIVLLKLFARLNEILSGEINRIPYKYQLAFYDFAGMNYIPATAARVPLTFQLSAGSLEAVVPERTQVASSLEPAIIYQTTESLTPLNLNIVAAYSVNPWDDGYTDHSALIDGAGEDFYIFGGDPSQQPISRVLYLADQIFNFKTPIDIRLYLQMNMDTTNNNNSYSCQMTDLLHVFTECTDGEGNQILFTIDDTKNAIVITDLIPPESEVDGKDGYWLALQPDPSITSADLKTLQVTSITCDITTNNIAPDLCMANDTVVDLKKGFDPFGEAPVIGDAFYIGSSEVLAKTGTTVTLTFDLTLGAGDATLQWQYWNGLAWEQIENDNNNIIDETDQLTKSGISKITFSKLPEIPEDELSGISSRWIRAVIIEGDYGHAGAYQAPASLDSILESILQSYIADPDDLNEAIRDLEQAGIFSGYVYSEATYQPPHINNITLNYTASGKSVAEIMTLNGSEFQSIDTSITPETPLIPFPALYDANTKPSFYLGFNEPFANYPLNLYFSCEAKLISDSCQICDPTVLTEKQTETSGFQWFYTRGEGWADLMVVDETENFAGSGLVKLIIPVDITKNKLFEQELYWFKVSPKDGSKLYPPKINGVFPNTVWAEQATFTANELLGTGNGQAGQEFSLTNSSVLDGQQIEVRESAIPSTSELELINSEEGNDAVRLVLNDADDLSEVWVRWHEVKNFTQSTPLSRHYLLDRKAGTVKFGDGLRGMIPPVITNNIMAREYKSGGGLQGNQAEKTITELKTALANIQSVTNFDAAVGGKDGEDNSALLERAPSSLKNYDRAVTPEDLESLALEASSSVIRARYVMPVGGEIEQKNKQQIKLVIATDTGTEPPSTDTGLVTIVRNYLQARAFVGIKDWIEVEGAAYRKIDVKANVIPESISDSVATRERVKAVLSAYFDPFQGGSDESGWQFGQTIYFSKVAALIEETEGVLSMTQLEINGRSLEDPGKVGQKTLLLRNTELPYAGNMVVELGGIDGGGVRDALEVTGSE